MPIYWRPYASWAADCARAALAYRILRGECIVDSTLMAATCGVAWRAVCPLDSSRRIVRVPARSGMGGKIGAVMGHFDGDGWSNR